jgi:hypothetical protein
MKMKELSYGGKAIKLFTNDTNELLLNDEDVQSGFHVSADEFKKIIDKNRDRFKENKDYILDEEKKRFWSKLGIVKLGFFNNNESGVEFIDFLETINLVETNNKAENLISKDNLISIYKTLENKFVDFSKKIEKEGDVDIDELKHFIETFNLFVKTRADILPHERPPVPTALLSNSNNKKGGILKSLFSIASKTGSDAMDFASQTRDQAYMFGSQTEKDAFTFTQDTRDRAHEFATKTEDDAFTFATKMEDDAFKFVSKMADDAYHFASDGMNYGYMFASQGEELGPMANRVLWMASEIGLMSDRIGEMSDRIVHTEHLIINMSVMILNFGLLIDGTIKTIAESGLHALAMVFDKSEVPELKSSSRHIELIGKNVELILTQQHEYDLRVLENQKDLREITISALDKISLEY